MSLRHPRNGEMQWDLFNYYPAAHKRRQIKQKWDELEDGTDLVPDGGDMHTGRRTSTLYYWCDPETDAALTHADVEKDGGEYAIPFFASVGEAEEYLEQRDDATDADLDHLSLYRAKVKKQEDAVDVLMDQAGLADF